VQVFQKASKAGFSNFCRCAPLSLQPNRCGGPFVVSTFFRQRGLRFGRFLAWAPQPPREEANFRLRPTDNCCRQNQIKKGQSTCNMNKLDYSCGATS